MPLVFVPESTYASTPLYGHSQHYHPYQQPAPSFYESDFARQRYAQPAYLSATPAPHEPIHHHVHPRRTASFDPIEAHKQRLIAEYAQQLEQAYPSPHHPAARQHEVRQPEPSVYELERIRSLEAQLAEQRLRKQLEVERARLVEARKEQQRREYEQAILKQREQQENQIREARLQQQRRLTQQQQLRQAAAAEQEHRRRQLAYLHAQQQQQQQRQARPQHSLEGLEQLFGLLGGCEPTARQEIEVSRSAPPPVQKQEHAQEQPTGGLEHFFAQFAKALEHGEADTQQPAPQAATKPTTATRSASPSGSSTSRSSSPNKVNKPLPPSPLTTLRSLHAKFVGLVAAKETSPHLAHQLEQLLLAADGIEADGNELVRSERKKVVREVESALERLEEKKEEVPVEVEEKVADEEPIAPAPAAQEVATEIAPIAVTPAQDAPSAIAEAAPIPEDTVTNAPISPAPASTSSFPVIAPAVISAGPTLAIPSPTSNTAAPDDHPDSDASSVASLSGSDADSGFSSDSGSVSAPTAKDKKTRKGRKAPSVEDWEKEEERYEFV